MANTTNFGWETPDDTDLVKDGAAAIRTLAGAIDTSLVDLKGGTTNQVLAKNSNTDMDFKWVADATGMTNPMTTTGDTIYSSSGSTPARLAIGSTGNVLTVAGGVPTWAAPAVGGLVLIHTESFTAQSSISVNNKFSATYDNYLILLNNVITSSNTYINMRLRENGTDDTSANYKAQSLEVLGSTVQSNRTTSNTSFINIDYINTAYQNATILEIQNPFNTRVTSGFTVQTGNSAGNVEGYTTWYGLNTTTSYDGLTIFANVGNLTGSFSIYGYAK